MLVEIVRDLQDIGEEIENAESILSPQITEEDREDFFQGPIYAALRKGNYAKLVIPSGEKGPWDESGFEEKLNQELNRGDMLGFSRVLDSKTAKVKLSMQPGIGDPSPSPALVFNKDRKKKKVVSKSKSHANVKIEYDSDSHKMTVQFRYNRKKLLSNGGGFWRSPEKELENLRSQIAHVVAVGLSDYNKGSIENPINIQYCNPKHPQPEAALSVLMELKKQAILEGKTFHAIDHNGNKIKIMPDEALSEDEKGYFMHFANVKVGERSTIGYQLLKLMDPDIKPDADKEAFVKSIEKAISNVGQKDRSQENPGRLPGLRK